MKYKQIQLNARFVAILPVIFVLCPIVSCDVQETGSTVLCDIPVLPPDLAAWSGRLTWQVSTSEKSGWADIDSVSEGSVPVLLSVRKEGAWIALRPAFAGPWGTRHGPVHGWVSGCGKIERSIEDGSFHVALSYAEGTVAAFLADIGKVHWNGFNIVRLCDEIADKGLTSETLDYPLMCDAMRKNAFSLSAIVPRKKSVVSIGVPAAEWIDFDGSVACRAGGGETGSIPVQIELATGHTTWLESTGNALLDLYLPVEGGQVQILRIDS